MKRRTVVCRADGCGGGWWGEVVPDVCPNCKGRLTELAPTRVTVLNGGSGA